MRLDGVRVGGMSGLCFLSPFSPLTETNPLIKLSGIKLKSQLSKRSITILKKKKKKNCESWSDMGPSRPPPWTTSKISPCLAFLPRFPFSRGGRMDVHLSCEFPIWMFRKDFKSAAEAAHSKAPGCLNSTRKRGKKKKKKFVEGKITSADRAGLRPPPRGSGAND